MIYQPGTFWSYSTAIDWAGRIVEKLTKETLETYMQKNIWTPLGIKNITFFVDQHPDMKAKQAGMSARNPQDGGLVPYNQPFLNANKTDCLGGQGTFATIPDYVKVLHSILADDEKLLKKETTAQMFKPQLTSDSKAGLKKLMNMPEVLGLFPGEYPLDREYDWGLGGLLCETEGKKARKSNTLVWSGLPNLFWVSMLPMSRVLILTILPVHGSRSGHLRCFRNSSDPSRRPQDRQGHHCVRGGYEREGHVSQAVDVLEISLGYVDMNRYAKCADPGYRYAKQFQRYLCAEYPAGLRCSFSWPECMESQPRVSEELSSGVTIRSKSLLRSSSFCFRFSIL